MATAASIKKKNQHLDLMIDLETLATSPNAVIGSIGAVWFYPHGPEEKCIVEKFHVHIELD